MTKLDDANKDIDLEFNQDMPADLEKVKCVKNMKNLLSKFITHLVINNQKITNILWKLKTNY